MKEFGEEVTLRAQEKKMEKRSLNRKKVGRKRLSTTASQKDMVDLQTEI